MNRHELFKSKSILSKVKKNQIIRDFEGCMRTTSHGHCVCCRRIRIKQKANTKAICKSCVKHEDPSHFLRTDGLPVWCENGNDENEPQCHVPPEPTNLSLAEKMPTQQVSPFVPLQHLKNGIMGLKGHVCAFEQRT